MLPRVLTLAALLLALPFAGCISEEEAPAAEGDAVTPATDAASPADPASGAGDATNGTARVVPVSLQGSLPNYVAVCGYAVVMGTCQYLPPGGTYNNHVEIAERGNLTKGTLTLTWTASSPLTEEMYITFYGYNEDDFHEVGFVLGASPLVLEVSDETFDPTMEYHVYVGVPTTGVNALVAGASVRGAREQAFTLEGALEFDA